MVPNTDTQGLCRLFCRAPERFFRKNLEKKPVVHTQITISWYSIECIVIF